MGGQLSQCFRQSSRFCWRGIPLEGLQRLRRERMTHPQVMKTNQAQKCCKQLYGALKVHIGRLSAKGMRTNILKWGRRMQISISRMGQQYANEYAGVGQAYANQYAGVGRAYANQY